MSILRVKVVGINIFGQEKVITTRRMAADIKRNGILLSWRLYNLVPKALSSSVTWTAEIPGTE
jgi:hypothetical protein